MSKQDVCAASPRSGSCRSSGRSRPTRPLRAIDAIRAGGVAVLEITMTVPGAIRVMRGRVASASATTRVVGAGTVLDAETARACILAGAQFIVSPGLDLDDDRAAAGATPCR